MDALAKSVLCFALIHQVVLVVHVFRRGDWGALNVFTMLDAQRLFPSLGLGTAAQLLSLLFAACVYALVFTFLTGREGRENVIPWRSGRPKWTLVSASSANGTGVGSRLRSRAPAIVRLARVRAASHSFRPNLWTGSLVLAAGLCMHMGCLTLVERLVPSFPSVPDVLLERLPYVSFGLPGELFFFAFVVAVTWAILRSPTMTASAVLTQLGLFYAVRGLFLFFLPIGSPADAPALTSRFVLYPFASHAYFPGGHAGLMTILSLSVHETRWRRAFLACTIVFAVGTMLARTHYTADWLGGALVGYAIVSWGRRHLDSRAVVASEAKAAAWTPPRRFPAPVSAPARGNGSVRGAPRPQASGTAGR